MFTGIIEFTSTITGITPYFEDNLPEMVAMRLKVKNSIGISTTQVSFNEFQSLKLGESIAVNGVCLTLEGFTENELSFYVSSETLQKTTFKDFNEGDVVNLERAMQAGGRISGHWVQGHVDGIAEMVALERASEHELANQYTMVIQIPKNLWKFCIEKGSITINGISLTINKLLPNENIALQIIPHTFQHTHLHQLLTKLNGGQKCMVNIEVDVLSKTIVTHLENIDWGRYVQK